MTLKTVRHMRDPWHRVSEDIWRDERECEAPPVVGSIGKEGGRVWLLPQHRGSSHGRVLRQCEGGGHSVLVTPLEQSHWGGEGLEFRGGGSHPRSQPFHLSF